MCVFRHLRHIVSRPAPEHRGKYARMPRKQICREFPLHSSALQTPMIMHPWHGTEATATGRSARPVVAVDRGGIPEAALVGQCCRS